ncbi:MAG: hypothetical protein QF619_07475 [Candidatus Binatia bacterium]|jgi:hypothetical protein|nr:hypothetical protein [Candidatus Binatia bacterium]
MKTPVYEEWQSGDEEKRSYLREKGLDFDRPYRQYPEKEKDFNRALTKISAHADDASREDR